MPCPFCGAPAEYRNHDPMGRNETVTCDTENCPAAACWSTAKAWNSRAPRPPALPADVEAVVDFAIARFGAAGKDDYATRRAELVAICRSLYRAPTPSAASQDESENVVDGAPTSEAVLAGVCRSDLMVQNGHLFPKDGGACVLCHPVPPPAAPMPREDANVFLGAPEVDGRYCQTCWAEWMAQHVSRVTETTR